MTADGAIVITGASSGIGEATARHLVELGWRVFGGIRSARDGRRLRSAGIEPVEIDVTDVGNVQRARDEVDDRLDGTPLVGLVNNAGIARAGPVETTSLDMFRETMEVNLLGVVRATRAFLPLLRRSRGRIVMVGSMSGKVAVPFLGPYAASKFALEGLSDSLRRELAPEGIRVVLIEPGPVATPIWDIARSIEPDDYRGGPYEARIKGLRAAALETSRGGIAPARVAAAIAAAITARRPRPRRIVASVPDRLRFELVRRLPDRLADALILRR